MKFGPMERFEIRAEAFRRMTGLMAPGKDAPIGSTNITPEERWEKFNNWCDTNQRLISAMFGAIEELHERPLKVELTYHVAFTMLMAYKFLTGELTEETVKKWIIQDLDVQIVGLTGCTPVEHPLGLMRPEDFVGLEVPIPLHRVSYRGL